MTTGRLVLALLAAVLVGGAAAASYTVQVIALSDRGRAEQLERRLLLDGFPAYLVETTTAQGDIFRVRVGAFGNRDAAVAYAEAMAGVAGSRPVPALADGIPGGVTPLVPRLLARFAAGERLELVPWRGAAAVRAQDGAAREEASYVVPAGDGVVTFRAWRAVPTDDGRVLRLRSLPLWPDDWRDRDEDARAAHRRALVAAVAERLGLEPAVLERAEVRSAGEAPLLLVVERFDPAGPGAGELLALALPDGRPSGQGPARLVGSLPALPAPPALLGLPADPELPSEVAGDGWTATGDAGFLQLRADGVDVPAVWRAGVGAPVWSDGDLLLGYAEGTYYLYDVAER